MVDLDLGDTRTILSACMGQNLLRNQAAYVLATTYWETNRTMEPVEEAYYLENRIEDMDAWREKNLRYYPWHGRGYVQLTWEANYHKAKAETGVDMIAEPTLAMRADVAAQVLVVGCRDGWFTGKRLDDYITLQSSNYRGARRVVNGTDEAAAIAEIAREYEAALIREGYGVEPKAPIVNDRLDGSAPRKNKMQSKTILALIQDNALKLSGGAGIWFAGLDTKVAIAISIGVGVSVLYGLYLARERIKHWGDGVR